MVRYSSKYLQITNKRFHGQYIQVPKLHFVNIENTTHSELIVKRPETSSSPPTMSQIDLQYAHHNREEIGEPRHGIIRISTLPSWYERLDSPSSYSLLDDHSFKEASALYRSFQRCYARLLASFTDNYLSLPDYRLKELQAKLPNQELAENIQQQLVKINVAARRFTELSSNTYTLYQRLKINRLTPPFYLHQQFLINLQEENIEKLIDLYFELPEPRPLYLKREEFEKLMRILLRLKISGNHKLLLPKLVQLYDDVRTNGKGIQLTSFETTKYFSFLLNLWKEQGVPLDERFKRVLKMKETRGTNKLVFYPAMWNIFLSHFPFRVDEIMKLMANESGLTRSTAATFIKYLKSFDSLNNTLELMKLKKFHLDPFLLDLIVEKYIEFGKSKEAFEIIKTIINRFEDISDMNYVIPSKASQRIDIFRIDVLNKTLQQMHNYNPEMKFSWLKYKFKPSPFTLGKLLLSLDTYNRYKLLKIMLEHKIPLSNKHALKLVGQRHLNSLPFILRLVNESQPFNEQLHHAIDDVKYDTKYLEQFVHDRNDRIVETNEIFDLSVSIYKENENDENISSIKSDIAAELIKFEKYKAL